MTPREETTGERVRGAIGVFVSLAAVTASLTVLWLSMRSVMDIGGSCASGGPYVPRVGCPTGVPMLMVGSIWLGLIFAALYFWMTFRHGAPSVGALFWPALFLSLGFNFLAYGLDPPFGLASVEVGWLVCAIVFGLMGGIPLLAAVPAVWRSFHGRGMKDRARDLIWPRRTAPATPTTRGAPTAGSTRRRPEPTQLPLRAIVRPATPSPPVPRPRREPRGRPRTHGWRPGRRTRSSRRSSGSRRSTDRAR